MVTTIAIVLVVVVAGWVVARLIWLAVKTRQVGLHDALRDDPFYRAESHVPITQAWAHESSRRFLLGKSWTGRLYYRLRGQNPPAEGQWLKERMAEQQRR